MKVLILLEHNFIIDENNNVWSETVIDNKYLSRYLDVFEEIVLCARMKKVQKGDKLLEKYNLCISGENIKFAPLPFAISAKEIIMNYVKTKREFKKALKKVDCAILRGPSILSLLLYKSCINRKNFSVEFVMGANEILSNNNIIRKMLNKFLDKTAQDMCLKANGVSYVTKELLQSKYPSYSIKYKDRNKKYFDTSYSSIDLYKNHFCEKNWSIIEKPNEYIIVQIGSMHTDRKGQERLIKISKKIINDGYNVKVKFIGDGRKKDELINMAEKMSMKSKISFLGNINNRDEIFKILRESHFFVLPTSSEGLPRSIIEAMATGTPCISSNVDGIPELLSEENLFEYNDIDGFAKRIEQLIDNWEEMINISNNNYSKAQEYEYEKLKLKRIEFYKMLKEISSL